MKIKPVLLLALTLFCLGSTGIKAQKVNVDVAGVVYPPEIDGIEEEIWDDVDPVYLVTPLGTENPTVTAYWKALSDGDNMYVLIYVEDDDHYPAWESGGNVWEFDKPELYFDVNDTLVDGLGPSTAGSGHYQFSPGFASDGYDIVHTISGTPQSPGGTYAYVLTGESYVYEQSILFSSMSNKYGIVMDCSILPSLPENMGFDVTIIDQDKDVTTSRQRAIWQSGDGPESEAWNNMDACGTITFTYACYIDCWNPECYVGIDNAVPVHITVQPNPVTDFLTISAGYDRVVIVNMLGQEIRTLNCDKTDRLNVGYLTKGVYVIKVFKSERFIGAAIMAKD